MTENEAIRIIEDGRATHSTLLHAGRFILGLYRELKRPIAVSGAPLDREKMTMAEKTALVCDSCAVASAYQCAKCAKEK